MYAIRRNSMKIKVSEVCTFLNSSYDLFICSASYEERCKTISRAVSEKNFKNIMISSNVDYEDYIKCNLDVLADIWKGNSVVINVSSEDPIKTADSYKHFFLQHMEIKSILFDITTFTHETLLIILKLISEIYNSSQIEVTFIYNSASEYCPGIKEEDKWLSKGVRKLHSILGFSGNLMPNSKDNLIIIVGYEYERAIKIIEMLEPSNLMLFYGETESQMPSKNKEANARVMKLIREISTEYSINPITIPCDDPFKTCNILLNNIVHSGMNNIIVPMNNKVTTVGAAMAALKNQDIQLCYSIPQTYNYNNYSMPSDICYIFKWDVNNG